jgi:hypothetical protein
VSTRKEPPVSKVPIDFRASLHLFRRSDGHGKPPMIMHRTTLQIYHIYQRF